MNVERQEEIRKKIEKCKEQLGYLFPRYERLSSEMKDLNTTIAKIYNHQHRLERLLAPIIKVKRKATTTTRLVLVSELSDEEAEALYQHLMQNKGGTDYKQEFLNK